MPWTASSRQYTVLRGACAVTETQPQSCATASKGAWPLSKAQSASYSTAVASCLERCAACSRCRWISVSPRFADCSWYVDCDTSALLTNIGGFVTLPANTSSAAAREVESVAAVLDTCPAEATGRRAVLQLGLRARHAAENRLVADGGSLARHTSSIILAMGINAHPLGEASRREYVRREYVAAAARVPGLVHRFLLGTANLPAKARTALRCEHTAAGDLLLLESSRDGHRRHFAEKVLLWLLHAARAFPTAQYVAKTDEDALVVWPRVAGLLRRHSALLPPAERPALVGRIEWASYNAPERRYCGCCGYSRRHARRTLQFSPGANFGSCARRQRPTGTASAAGTAGGGVGGAVAAAAAAASQGTAAASVAPVAARARAEGVVGPFFYAQGAFEALNTALVRCVAALGLVHDELLPGLLNGSTRAARGEEDLLLGRLAYHHCGRTVAVGWGDSVAHDFDHGEGKDHRAYFAIERRCLAALNVTRPAQLVTGRCSSWGTPETLGPMSAVVHRVRSAAEWRRASALAWHWTARLEAAGEPECAFPSEVVPET